MELTINELKILKKALNSKLRNICIGTPEFDDTKKALYKVNTEIERIDIDIKQKACGEAFKAISDILKPKKINHSLDDIINNIYAIAGFEFSSGAIEPFIKIEVDYAMLKDGELETLLSFKDKNKNCVITFK